MSLGAESEEAEPETDLVGDPLIGERIKAATGWSGSTAAAGPA